jgi:hydroxymethylglutaryl-CoA lyase
MHSIEIVEVAARDGLQAEHIVVSTADKIELIQRAVAAGFRRIETASFVNPARVPQMADWVEVMRELNTPGVIPNRADCSFIGLVLNRRGLDSALAAGVDEINTAVVITDTFAEKNQGKNTAGLVEMWRSLASEARAAGLFTSVTLSASFGCPYEGEVSDERFERVLEAVLEDMPDELSLADTIGVASPTQVRRRIEQVRNVAPDLRLRCHFHNTRNTGLVSAAAAVEAGVSVLDSSLGGVGGCPFAPNATGNIPTEDLVFLLHRMGYDTGIDLEQAITIAPWLATVIGHDTPALVPKAGLFPRSAA